MNPDLAAFLLGLMLATLVVAGLLTQTYRRRFFVDGFGNNHARVRVSTKASLNSYASELQLELPRHDLTVAFTSSEAKRVGRRLVELAEWADGSLAQVPNEGPK